MTLPQNLKDAIRSNPKPARDIMNGLLSSRLTLEQIAEALQWPPEEIISTLDGVIESAGSMAPAFINQLNEAYHLPAIPNPIDELYHRICGQLLGGMQSGPDGTINFDLPHFTQNDAALCLGLPFARGPVSSSSHHVNNVGDIHTVHFGAPIFTPKAPSSTSTHDVLASTSAPSSSSSHSTFSTQSVLTQSTSGAHDHANTPDVIAPSIASSSSSGSNPATSNVQAEATSIVNNDLFNLCNSALGYFTAAVFVAGAVVLWYLADDVQKGGLV